MLAEQHPDLNVWLAARQPAHGTDLLRLALADVVPPETSEPPSADEAEDLKSTPDIIPTAAPSLLGQETTALPTGESFRVGARIPSGAQVSLDLAVLSKHTVLFAGEGEPVDPGILLTPPPGKRARVSVISMIGLPDPPRSLAGSGPSLNTWSSHWNITA